MLVVWLPEDSPPHPTVCQTEGSVAPRARGSGISSQGAAVSPTELLSKQDPYLWLCESPDWTPISSGMKVFLPVLLAALLGVERGEMPPHPGLRALALREPCCPLSQVVPSSAQGTFRPAPT